MSPAPRVRFAAHRAWRLGARSLDLFVLPNLGTSQIHEFHIGPADRVALDQVDGQIVEEADRIEPLHVSYITYAFGSVGPYAFACHEPGHYESGMKGIIDLSPGRTPRASGRLEPEGDSWRRVGVRDGTS